MAERDPIETQQIDGVWRVVDEREPDPDLSPLLRIGVGIVVAIVMRLVIFGPIHH